MSLLGKLFGKTKRQPLSSIKLAATRGFPQAVVGELNYQREIGRIVGGKSEFSASYACHALLVCDDKNKHDANAVQVRIKGAVVGYLPRDEAKKYREELTQVDISMPSAVVRAKIVGGWLDEESEGNFGVKLSLKRPLAKTKA